MTAFTIFPAIDLRAGQVVRLSQGDPDKQKVYSSDPEIVARSMLEQGATWLHVINLDGAFGESSTSNLSALAKIIQTAREFKAHIQFGGGLHTLDQVRAVLSNGIDRAILGSMAVKEPENIRTLLSEFNTQQIGVSLDGRKNEIMVSGWQKASGITVFDLADNLKSMGLAWIVYTDIDRDGMQSGSNFETTISLARKTKMNIIASGGVSTIQEVKALKTGGAAGAIIGRALYEGTLGLPELLECAR
ncbi:1-(5-phosphoribosyl)-5-[(5-phosphoribosylamino)methylideneamino]imidazole-4-carboxamide isomerase [Leptolinea tardivitalis]|uniref:1-(5-phosphoribosyl)-5-[(5-phosphoribosylamino)methylideneamino] imidazole-4-carboxamide isomerase n=1 Tax=Leptolinea tardivitalis TaxID=229920 RepID=A0A0P6XGD0_9CHLR|nr:1-(5-phosphoribosyl)-5-[(5-phosphoribosylamino)methylideneamino]imidazole-4-carboxamide isomerase [Leptolinea tardivitalis]KPL74319.1 hypothetical protein ADM99_01760 [Leptolinea tardivitalis]GAP20493.1 1-(5-phosphoribosyl)-5-[(5-phosphoribosylamino) methylideneamino] imidazole-4-carboxamide isomerase [Leptolinea tardivitalis]